MSKHPALRYVKNGPDAGGESILRRILGFWLWWRMWVMAVVSIASLLILVGYGPSEGDARFWGYMVGSLTMLAISEVMDDE